MLEVAVVIVARIFFFFLIRASGSAQGQPENLRAYEGWHAKCREALSDNDLIAGSSKGTF